MYTDEASIVEKAVNGPREGESEHEHGRQECGRCDGKKGDAEDYRRA